MTENAFADIDGAQEIQEVAAESKLLMAIIGRPKTGKSWFAATAPGNVLALDYDNRAKSFETLPKKFKDKLRVVTLYDLSQKNPTAFAKTEAILSRLKYRKESGLVIPDSYILDSGTYLKTAIENMYFSGGGSFRELRVSSSVSIRRGKDWDTVNTVVGAFQYLITEFSQLGNLIMVFHERPQKDKAESTKDTTVYTDETTLDPQYLEPIISRFNEYMRISLDYKDDYVVQCRPTEKFKGATTLMIDKEEKPDLMAMIDKHKLNIKEKETKENAI